MWGMMDTDLYDDSAEQQESTSTFTDILYIILMALLTPFFALLYITQTCVKGVTFILPLTSLFIILAIGLPVLTVSKCVYGLYLYGCLLYAHVRTVLVYCKCSDDDEEEEHADYIRFVDVDASADEQQYKDDE